MDSDAVIPDEKDMGIKSIVDRLNEIKEKTADEKYDELFYMLNQYGGWVEGLKPMIQARIEAYKEMREVDFKGNESMSEVGMKFLLSSLVANELQDLLDQVESRRQQVAEDKDKKKEK